MKYSILMIAVCFSFSSAFSQGQDCSSAVIIPMDGTLSAFATSPSTGANVICAANGTTPITWFKFTTNATGECPLLNITAADGQAVEMAMYTSCSGNMNNNLEAASSMCFYDGTGLWAPAQDYVLTANTTYYLRVKTVMATTISIGGQSYTPSNDDCAGATPISGTPVSDNNSCHTPGPGVMASDLCAFTLENTAFYEFTVAATGSNIITISDIVCDNGSADNNPGFQIGFFQGNCSALTVASPCVSGAGTGGMVQATTGSLPAGTRIFVAVDGTSGSNCKYKISANNAIVLAAELKNFSAWKTEAGNILKWTYAGNAAYFELERNDGSNNFSAIHRIAAKGDNNYSIEDRSPLQKGEYRLKIYNKEGGVTVSKILKVHRSEIEKPQLTIQIKAGLILIKYHVAEQENIDLHIVDLKGRRIVARKLNAIKGANFFEQNISTIPPGWYSVSMQTLKYRVSSQFIKTP